MNTSANFSNKDNIANTTVLAAAALAIVSGLFTGNADAAQAVPAVQKMEAIVVTAKRLPAPKLDTIIVTAPRIASRA
jgi:hypothetical protein